MKKAVFYSVIMIALLAVAGSAYAFGEPNNSANFNTQTHVEVLSRVQSVKTTARIIENKVESTKALIVSQANNAERVVDNIKTSAAAVKNEITSGNLAAEVKEGVKKSGETYASFQNNFASVASTRASFFKENLSQNIKSKGKRLTERYIKPITGSIENTVGNANATITTGVINAVRGF